MDPTSYGVDESRLQATQVCVRRSHLFCAKIALECETLRPFAIFEVAFSTADDRGDRPRCTNGAFSTEWLGL